MKTFAFIFAFLTALTIVIVSINPQMPKTMNVGGAKLAVKNNDSIKNTDLKVENKGAIVDKNKTSLKSVDSFKKANNLGAKNVDVIDKFDELVKLQEQADKAQQKFKLTQPDTQKETVNKEKKLRNSVKQKAIEEVEKKSEEQRELVEYQENILWNQWRANVCNNVAKKLDKQFTSVAPVGTIYTYSFDVDDKRRITNIVVRISRGYVNATTQQGVFMIKQAIQSLNLSTILTYPSGSERTTVKVLSAIERTASYSTSLDANSFNDVETITKQEYQ